MKHRKRTKANYPLTPSENSPCPLERAAAEAEAPARPSIVVVRTEKRSWLGIAFTGFGALILRYIRVIRERGRKTLLF